LTTNDTDHCRSGRLRRDRVRLLAVLQGHEQYTRAVAQMRLGFTGPHTDPTYHQQVWLESVFDNLQIDVLHHGAGRGSCLAAHELALQHDIPVVVHPPSNTKFLAVQCLNRHPNVTVLPAAPYLVRDRAIVGSCDGLVAMPKNEQPAGLNISGIGGTWYTVLYAERMNKQIVICYPDGTVEKRETKILRNPGGQSC
jgi:hypothetical protein